MDHSNSNLSSLTDDLIIDILRRLPVKSLIRFCCVCKFWNSLIRFDPDFIKSHLKLSLSNNPAIARNVMIYYEPEFRKNHALDRMNPNYELGDLFLGHHYVFVGSSNGILCYYSKFMTSIDNPINRNQINVNRWDSAIHEFKINVHLWNPATHEFRSLPEGNCGGDSYDQVFVMFDYDPVMDDYKVMKFHYSSYVFRPFLGEVYSLSTNTWKMINLTSFASNLRFVSNMVAHNGALNCITSRGHGSVRVLSVFDIDEEKFDQVSLPDFQYRIKPMPRLGTFKEFISLSIWRENLEVWVMKEYGIWTRQFVLVNTPKIHTPSGITASGKILAVNWKGEDVLYDGESQKVKKIVQNKMVFIKATSNDSDSDHVVVAEYVESLISVFPPPPPETGETTNTSETAASCILKLKQL